MSFSKMNDLHNASVEWFYSQPRSNYNVKLKEKLLKLSMRSTKQISFVQTLECVTFTFHLLPSDDFKPIELCKNI